MDQQRTLSYSSAPSTWQGRVFCGYSACLLDVPSRGTFVLPAIIYGSFPTRPLASTYSPQITPVMVNTQCLGGLQRGSAHAGSCLQAKNETKADGKVDDSSVFPDCESCRKGLGPESGDHIPDKPPKHGPFVKVEGYSSTSRNASACLSDERHSPAKPDLRRESLHQQHQDDFVRMNEEPRAAAFLRGTSTVCWVREDNCERFFQTLHPGERVQKLNVFT